MKVFYFSGSWCAPCKMLMPLAEAACKAAKVPFIVHDVEAESSVATAMRVTTLPTVVVLSNDEEVFRFSGTFDIQALKKVLEG